MSTIEELQIPQLKGSANYQILSIQMRALLTDRDLHLSLSTTTTGRKNEQALAVIQLYCEDGPLAHIQNIKDCQIAWQTLEELYSPNKSPTEFLLLNEFFNTSMDQFDTMEEYLDKIRALVNGLALTGYKLPTNLVISWVLNNLNKDHEALIQPIVRSMGRDENLCNIESLFSTLINESNGMKHGNHAHQKKGVPKLLEENCI